MRLALSLTGAEPYFRSIAREREKLRLREAIEKCQNESQPNRHSRLRLKQFAYFTAVNMQVVCKKPAQSVDGCALDGGCEEVVMPKSKRKQ